MEAWMVQMMTFRISIGWFLGYIVIFRSCFLRSIHRCPQSPPSAPAAAKATGFFPSHPCNESSVPPSFTSKQPAGLSWDVVQGRRAHWCVLLFLLNLETDLRQYIESHVQTSFNKCASRNKMRTMMKLFIIQFVFLPFKKNLISKPIKKPTNWGPPSRTSTSNPITTPADTLKEVSLHSVPLPPQNDRVVRLVPVVACDPGDP